MGEAGLDPELGKRTLEYGLLVKINFSALVNIFCLYKRMFCLSIHIEVFRGTAACCVQFTLGKQIKTQGVKNW